MVTLTGLLAKYSLFICCGVLCERFERSPNLVLFRGPSKYLFTLLLCLVICIA